MQVFVLERVIPPLVITFKLAVNSVSSNHIFALFLFLFNSHYLKKVSIDPVQNLSIKVRKYPWTWSMTGDPWNGPKWGSMDPWSMFCPLDPKQSQDRVSNLSFPIAHLPTGRLTCANSGKILVADPRSSGLMNGGRPKISPPIHTSGMSLSSQANRSSDRLDM